MSGPRPRLEVTVVARQDLTEISLWTAERWGIEQQDRYEQMLMAGILALRDFPGLGHLVDRANPTVRRSIVGRHVVYYRELIDGVRVIRVLHERQHVTQAMLTEETE